MDPAAFELHPFGSMPCDEGTGSTRTEMLTNVTYPTAGTAAVTTVPKEGDGAAESKTVSQLGLFEMDYENFHHSTHRNISGALWFNYSCLSHEISSNFLKDVIEPVICCVGAIGIIITMVVLTRKYMCTSCNCYLTALAIGDLLFLLILFARTLTEKLTDCSFHFSGEYIIFSVYSIILQEICLYFTIGVTVMLAIERYIAVCHPMRSMRFCTIQRARTIIVLIFLVAFILRSPKFMDIEVSYVSVKSGGKILSVTWAFPYNERMYTYIVTAGILTFFPLLTLLILNVRIILELRRSSRYLQYYLGTDWRNRSLVYREEFKITLMLIGVVLAFFVCHVPYMIFSLILAFKNYDTHQNESLTNSSALKYFQHVCRSFLLLRSSCNFILYCWFSEKFWATFKRVFCIPACNAKHSSVRPERQNKKGNQKRFHSNSCVSRSSFNNTRDTTF